MKTISAVLWCLATMVLFGIDLDSAEMTNILGILAFWFVSSILLVATTKKS